jgi:DNA-binding MarR family transcriptional regulator
MTQPLPLSPTIGATERTLFALLNSRLERHGISFPEWTVMFFLSEDGLPQSVVLDRLASGRVAEGDAATALIEAMVQANRIESVDGGGETEAHLALTPQAKQVFLPLRAQVAAAAQEIYADIPQEDIEITRRTLEQVSRQAAALLARSNAATQRPHSA